MIEEEEWFIIIPLRFIRKRRIMVMLNLGNIVTKESVWQMAEFKRSYLETCEQIHALEHKEFLCDEEQELLLNAMRHKKEMAEYIPEINRFTDKVINCDKHYFEKLSSYNLDKKTLYYCMA